MKKQLTLAAFLGAAMLLGAADTCDSLCKEGHALRKKRNPEAAAKFDSALKLAANDSSRFWCCYYRSGSFMDCKKYAETADSARESLKYAAAPNKDGISEQQALAYWQIGLACRYMGKMQESLDGYSASVKLAPRQSWIFANSSNAAGDDARMLKKYDEAIGFFKQLFECEKAEINARSGARFQWALVLITQKKESEALKLLENAEQFSPKLNDNSKAQIWDARGRAYQSQRKWNEGVKAYLEMEKYVGKDESYRAFCNLQLASLYSCQKDLANAAKHAQACLDCKKASWGRDVNRCKEMIAQYEKSLKK